MLPQQNPTRARFDLFVKLKPGIVSHLPGQKRTWCYRGDKFTDDEPKMLRNLIQMASKRLDSLEILEIYDNRLPLDSPARIILKISSGVIEKNRMQYYRDMISTMPLTETFKTIIYDSQPNQG